MATRWIVTRTSTLLEPMQLSQDMFRSLGVAIEWLRGRGIPLTDQHVEEIARHPTTQFTRYEMVSTGVAVFSSDVAYDLRPEGATDDDFHPNLTALVEADVDADIASGVLAADRRGERIARRRGNYAIVVARDAFGYRDTQQYLCVSLVDRDTSSAFAGVEQTTGAPRTHYKRRIIGAAGEQDATFVREAVDALQRDYGPLPVRCNTLAMPAFQLAGLAA